MAGYSASTTIDASVDEVYALVADIATHPQWAADELTVEAVSDDTWRTTARAKGASFTADLVVTEATPPARFAFEVTDETGHWRHRFDLAATTSGCRVTRHVEPIELRPVQRLLYWVVRVPVKRPSLRTSLERLTEVARS